MPSPAPSTVDIRPESTPHAPPPPSGLSADKGLALLDTVASIVTLRRDETLFYEGDPADRYYKVVTGAIRSCRLLGDGRRHIGKFFFSGNLISLRADGAHPFTAEAVCDATVLRYNRRRVDMLISNSQSVGKYLLARACSKVYEAHGRMFVLDPMTAQERIASFLLRMAAHEGCETHACVALPMMLVDIGDHLGPTSETACRSLTEFRRRGFISFPNSHRIRVRRRHALGKLAEGR